MNEAKTYHDVKATGTKHGLGTLKRAFNALGNRALDRRTTVSKSLEQWRADLIADLGGSDAVSTQQLAIVNLAIKTKLLLDSVDGWLLTQKTLINFRRRSVYPVVLQRQQLADELARYMAQLGLQRRLKPAKSISELLSQPSNGAAAEAEHDDQHPTNGAGHPAV